MTTLRTPRALTTFAATCTMIASLAVVPTIAHAADTPYDSDEITINSQGHVDSPKIFWDTTHGTFILNAKGDILRPLHKTTNYLSKTVTGRTQEYYYTIPNDPRQKFLGNHGGHLFWAPNNVMPRSNQLWIGFGADAEIPVEHFRDESFTLDLVGFEGPGRMDLFTATLDEDFMAENPVDRLLSSHEPGLRSTWIKPGLHTHNHTTFSQPGRYKVSYRASARLKDGQLLASAPQTVYWQVGGQHPSETHPETVVDRYNASSATLHADSTFNPTFSVKPATSTEEPPLLTELSFTTGDSSDSGSAVFYVNGYFLAEVPVTGGRASWTELIGPQDADLQVVYIPANAQGSPRWVSEPLSYAQGDLSDDTSTLGTFPSPATDESLPAFSFGDRVVKDRKVSVGIDDSNDTYTVTATPADTRLAFRVVGGFYSQPDDTYPTCHVDFISYPGQRSYTMLGDDCTNVSHVKLRLVPDSLTSVGATELSAPIAENSGTHAHELTFAAAPYVPQTQPEAPYTPPSGDNGQSDPKPSNPSDSSTGDRPQSEPSTPHGSTPPATGDHAQSLPPASTPPNVTPPGTQPGHDQGHGHDNNGMGRHILTAPARITDGHLDVGPQVIDGRLVMVLKDDSRQHVKKSVLRDPTSVTIEVPSQARITRSERYFGDTAFDFLGDTGTELYVLGSTQIEGRPWPGFSTEAIDYDQFPNGVSLEFIPDQKPENARWWGFTSSTFGGLGQMIVDSSTPMRLDLPRRTHMHLNWLFTHPGTYTMKVRALPTPGAGLRSAGLENMAPSEFTTVTFHVGTMETTDHTAPSDPKTDQTPGQNDGSTDRTQSFQSAGNGRSAQGSTPGQNSADQSPSANATQSGTGAVQTGTTPTLNGTLINDKTSGPTGGKQPASRTQGTKLASTGSTLMTLLLAGTLFAVAGGTTLRMHRTRLTQD